LPRRGKSDTVKAMKAIFVGAAMLVSVWSLRAQGHLPELFSHQHETSAHGGINTGTVASPSSFWSFENSSLFMSSSVTIMSIDYYLSQSTNTPVVPVNSSGSYLEDTSFFALNGNSLTQGSSLNDSAQFTLPANIPGSAEPVPEPSGTALAFIGASFLTFLFFKRPKLLM